MMEYCFVYGELIKEAILFSMPKSNYLTKMLLKMFGYQLATA